MKHILRYWTVIYVESEENHIGRFLSIFHPLEE
jgi:hypothetical protein